MKNTLIALTILLTTTQLFSQEAPKTDRTLKNVITVNPFSLANGELDFTYERAINFRSAIEVRGAYSNEKLRDFSLFDFDLFQIGARYKFYALKKENRQQGLYLYSGSNYKYNKLKFGSSSTFEASTVNLELGAGYQFVLNKLLKGLTLDLNIGQEYIIPLGNSRDFNFNRTQTTARIGLGYSF